MHRPKKNKIHNPTLPEDQQQVDERHLIDAKDSEDISFEDRMSIYWMENKAFIIGCIVVLLVAIVGFQGMRVYQQHAIGSLQAKYAEARATETLPEFARANSNRALGGFAALATADEAFAESDYATALEYYRLAAGALRGNLLEGRARLGEAFARYHSGETEAGLAQLNAIAADTRLAGATRAEAAYHLAVEADVAGRTEDFERYAAQITNSPLAGQWQQRLNFYQQQR